MKQSTKRFLIAGCACVSTIFVVATATLLRERRSSTADRVHLVYTRQGDGGFIPAPKTPPRTTDRHSVGVSSASKADPIQPIYVAYNAGNYNLAMKSARTIIGEDIASRPAVRRNADEARLVLAYSYARERDLKDAKTQFAELQQDAAKLPDKGIEPAKPGEGHNTLEAEAAYEQAVCTAALGDKKGAEAEYLAFMRDYPNSPFLNAAAMRIMRLNGGVIPAAVQAVWRHAKKVAMDDADQAMRKQSLCGPECLSEMLRRSGDAENVATLAKEAKTNASGTSLADLATAAAKHKLSLSGFALTENGLLKQRFPVIALTRFGHYVILERATSVSVEVWDPDGHGVGHATRVTLPTNQWMNIWQGSVLAPVD